jgi:hypothetical protein
MIMTDNPFVAFELRKEGYIVIGIGTPLDIHVDIRVSGFDDIFESLTASIPVFVGAAEQLRSSQLRKLALADADETSWWLRHAAFQWMGELSSISIGDRGEDSLAAYESSPLVEGRRTPRQIGFDLKPQHLLYVVEDSRSSSPTGEWRRYQTYSDEMNAGRSVGIAGDLSSTIRVTGPPFIEQGFASHPRSNLKRVAYVTGTNIMRTPALPLSASHGARHPHYETGVFGHTVPRRGGDRAPKLDPMSRFAPQSGDAGHDGQKKLLQVAIRAAQMIGEVGVKHVIYAGSAPGSNINFLVGLLPDVKFTLYDPLPTHVWGSNVTVVLGPYNGEPCDMLISDVRSDVDDEFQFEEQVADDNMRLSRWLIAAKPKVALLKWRPSYPTASVRFVGKVSGAGGTYFVRRTTSGMFLDLDLWAQKYHPYPEGHEWWLTEAGTKYYAHLGPKLVDYFLNDKFHVIIGAVPDSVLTYLHSHNVGVGLVIVSDFELRRNVAAKLRNAREFQGQPTDVDSLIKHNIALESFGLKNGLRMWSSFEELRPITDGPEGELFRPSFSRFNSVEGYVEWRGGKTLVPRKLPPIADRTNRMDVQMRASVWETMAPGVLGLFSVSNISNPVPRETVEYLASRSRKGLLTFPNLSFCRNMEADYGGMTFWKRVCTFVTPFGSYRWQNGCFVRGKGIWRGEPAPEIRFKVGKCTHMMLFNNVISQNGGINKTDDHFHWIKCFDGSNGHIPQLWLHFGRERYEVLTPFVVSHGIEGTRFDWCLDPNSLSGNVQVSKMSRLATMAGRDGKSSMNIPFRTDYNSPTFHIWTIVRWDFRDTGPLPQTWDRTETMLVKTMSSYVRQEKGQTKNAFSVFRLIACQVLFKNFVPLGLGGVNGYAPEHKLFVVVSGHLINQLLAATVGHSDLLSWLRTVRWNVVVYNDKFHKKKEYPDYTSELKSGVLTEENEVRPFELWHNYWDYYASVAAYLLTVRALDMPVHIIGVRNVMSELKALKREYPVFATHESTSARMYRKNHPGEPRKVDWRQVV